MAKHIIRILLLITALYTGRKTVAQQIDYVANKEKIYVHTSHVFFKPGETMYFKIYVVSAKDQTPTNLSGIVHAEIIQPSGTILQKLQYKVQDGYAEGSFTFTDQIPGGVYKLRAYTTWMRNERDSTFFVKEITLQKAIAPRILMKLEFPQKGYGPGDVVTAHFSMRNLNNEPIRNHQAKFTVSIGGKIIETTPFKTDDRGQSLVQFKLPHTLKTSDGLLNITVTYDSYTEAISRSIPIALNTIDLQFMPEGGTLIEGITTNIAFRAINEHGKPVDVKGDVLDNSGSIVASFASYQFGMGKFTFTPQRLQSYSIRITTPANNAQQFTLPAAASQGVVMNITKAGSRLIVKLTATENSNVLLTGETKGVSYYALPLALKKGENSIDVNADLFPAGITKFTLYTTGKLPVAERLVFLHEQRRLQLHITPDKQTYLPREKVQLTLKTTDENGLPVPSNLSLAVVDDKLWSFADDKQNNILSWLLMSSELKGAVEEPAFYFKQDEPKAVPALDLVMLTHGYRYFDYTDDIKKDGKLKYLPDQGSMVSGLVVNAQGHPAKATLFLIDGSDGKKAIRFNTGADGLFFFSDLPSGNRCYLLAQSNSPKEKVAIQILQQGIGYNILQSSIRETLLNNANLPDTSLALAIKQWQTVNQPLTNEGNNTNNFFFDINESNLDDVVVIGYGIVNRRFATGSITTVTSETIVNNISTTLAGKAPGVDVQANGNPGADEKITIRGLRTVANAAPPLFVLNGVPLEQFRLGDLEPADIASITVLKDAAATSIYGARAANGVIIIETRKIRNDKIRINLTPRYYCAAQYVQPTTPLFSAVRRFYAPKYLSLETPVRNDFRETIYWNPVVQTDKQGLATVEFWNSDASTTFRVIAEGIGYNGKTGRAEGTYVTRNAMTVDAKIPSYLTVGDKAIIPLFVKNNTGQSLPVMVRVGLPGFLKQAAFTESLLLEAGRSQQINIPVEAVATGNDSIRFIVSTGFNTEKLVLPLAVAQKGFQIIQTFAGNQTTQHSFTIDETVPGSIKARLKLYTSLEGQLLDNIESMLCEPYGCFEQTSSTTYPNIFILKYLRESGTSNPDIEKKALGYIESGYKRLIGFETADHGFEWFGRTSPHEALTAYGLLEFTEMQEFIPVDKAMLDRTKQFLLSRRDGKGAFKLAQGKYDHIGAIPGKIANMYIVYVLTQIGMGNDIQLEYHKAVKTALEGHDMYQLALMALAASNMKNENDYRALMTILNDQYQRSKFTAETSVVNSKGVSLKIESLSLYALALMRDPSPDLAKIAMILSGILAEKTYYGYGATQATVLALQAIVAYSRIAGRVTEHPQITFMVNNKAVTEDEDVLQYLQQGNNQFSVTYPSSTQASIPYSLEVAYNTFTPPNSENAELKLATHLSTAQTIVGETVRLEIAVHNEKNEFQPMAIAKIGIPAGLSMQPWQLKEIVEKEQAAYYEIFDNYLVLYWMGLAPGETRQIDLDLKADVAGKYKGKASNAYLYYMPENKHWNAGLDIEIK